MEAAPKAAVVQAQHEQELRQLLTKAQEDIEKHRKLATVAQHDKQAVLEQVGGRGFVHQTKLLPAHISAPCTYHSCTS